MAIPDYQSIMLPLLKFAGDQEEHSVRQAIDSLAQELQLTDEERKQLLPSGQQEVFNNRVAWARTYMKEAALLQSSPRGSFSVDNPSLLTQSSEDQLELADGRSGRILITRKSFSAALGTTFIRFTGTGLFQF